MSTEDLHHMSYNLTHQIVLVITSITDLFSAFMPQHTCLGSAYRRDLSERHVSFISAEQGLYGRLTFNLLAGNQEAKEDETLSIDRVQVLASAVRSRENDVQRALSRES